MPAAPLEQQHKATVQDITDEEEDLDDLDDVLSQFAPASKAAFANTGQPQPQGGSSTSPPAPPPTATASTFHRPRTNTRVDAPPVSIPGSGIGAGLHPTSEQDEDALSDEFAKQLAKGMESLIRELAGGPLPGEAADDEKEDSERQFKAAWEAMLIDGLGGEDAGLGEAMSESGVGAKGKSNDQTRALGTQGDSSGSGENSDFQGKIRQTMGKLRESESTLQADTTPTSGSKAAGPGVNDPIPVEAFFAALRGDEGGEDSAELAGFLENMMSQLMSKEVLYEPLKELAEKFPPYLASPPTPLSASDRQQYESQLTCVHKILAIFEEPGYDDENVTTGKAVVDLMSELQLHGSPPVEVMGQLPPGLGLGPDGMPQMGEGCVIA